MQEEELNVKVSQRYNVTVLMNHHQELEKMISTDVKSLIDV